MATNNEKVYTMKLSKVYPLLVAKAERKGRTRQEVDEVTCWLTGYDVAGLNTQIENDVDYRTFFKQAPEMNPDRTLIKGVICGIRVENIVDPLMQNIRYLILIVPDTYYQYKEIAKRQPLRAVFRDSSFTNSPAKINVTEIFKLLAPDTRVKVI